LTANKNSAFSYVFCQGESGIFFQNGLPHGSLPRLLPGNLARCSQRYGPYHHHLKLDIDPTRHAITRGIAIYFWEPSGNRIETYSNGYTAYPDNPQRVCDADQLGQGLFYFSGEMIPIIRLVVGQNTAPVFPGVTQSFPLTGVQGPCGNSLSPKPLGDKGLPFIKK
jgi:hypothetical protein